LLVLLAGESCKKYLFRSNKKNKKNDLKKHALYIHVNRLWPFANIHTTFLDR